VEKCKKCNAEIDESNSVLGTCMDCLSKPAKKKTRNDIPYRYRKLKERCKHLNRTFSIDIETYTKRINEGCYYCGCDIKSETGGGMDRIDPENFSYTNANTVAACSECNNIRGFYLTVGEMQAVAKALNEYRLEHGYEKAKNRMQIARKKKSEGVE
jgi:5-methylcytosine-specific restriction endonuclease McrA